MGSSRYRKTPYCTRNNTLKKGGLIIMSARFSLGTMFLFAIFSSIYAADILFANMYNSKSHALSMLPLAKSLASRGHHVTMFSEMLKPGIELNGTIENAQVFISHKIAGHTLNALGLLAWHLDFIPDGIEGGFLQGDLFFQHSINSETFQRILNRSWDLVVADEMFPNSAATISLNLRKTFGTRIALFSTTDFFNAHSTLRALARNPIAAPKLTTFRDVLIEQVSIGLLGDRIIKRGARRIGLNTGFRDLFPSASITFNEYFNKYLWPSTISNTLIFTTTPCEVPQQLPVDIDEFIGDPHSRGTIYVAFGSIVHWKVAPSNVIRSFIEAFNSLNEYRIIWSIDVKAPEGLAAHVKTIAWAPQSAILYHERTKLFFTHAGLKSIKEAICAGVPLLTLPFFADQMKNSLLAHQSGFAEIIHKRKITSVVLLNAILKILQDDTYRQKIAMIRSIYKDHIMAPLEVETFWAERILRSKRMDVAFRIHGIEMSLIPYIGLDVVLIPVCAILLLSQ